MITRKTKCHVFFKNSFGEKRYRKIRWCRKCHKKFKAWFKPSGISHYCKECAK